MSRNRSNAALFLLGTALAFLIPGVILHAQSPAAQTSAEEERAKSLYAHGMQAVQQGDLDGAHQHFAELVRLAPKSPEAHNSFGWVLLHQGQIDVAIAQFNSAVKLRPSFGQAHLNLANALAARQDFAEAETQAREAVRFAPKDSEAHR